MNVDTCRRCAGPIFSKTAECPNCGALLEDSDHEDSISQSSFLHNLNKTADAANEKMIRDYADMGEHFDAGAIPEPPADPSRDLDQGNVSPLVARAKRRAQRSLRRSRGLLCGSASAAIAWLIANSYFFGIAWLKEAALGVSFAAFVGFIVGIRGLRYTGLDEQCRKDGIYGSTMACFSVIAVLVYAVYRTIVDFEDDSSRVLAGIAIAAAAFLIGFLFGPRLWTHD